MKTLIDSQKQFLNTGTTRDIDFRISMLKMLRSILRKNESILNEAIFKDFGKSEFDTFSSELGIVYHDIDEAIKKVRGWAARKRVSTNMVNFPAKSYIIPEPLGVSLIIGAWNYPYQLSLAPCVAAIAAGCTVILKPSELPSHTSGVMAKLINDNFASEFFTVVEGGIDETTELLKQKFDKIFFTGSVPVGRIVYKAAAENLTPVTLELGGKSPAFITENCNMKIAVKRLIWAKFLNAGQTCIAPDYILVHSSVKDKFIKAAGDEIKKSEYSVKNGNYVKIINDKNFDRVINLIEEDKIIHGGNFNKKERTIEPTIMSDVTFDDKIMQDEIFGPILPVIEYTDIDKAINEVVARPKPLSCYVFTNDKKIKEKILSRISFGGGAVNDSIMHIANSNLPFGGVGNSGIGSYHAENGFKAFTHYKSILDKPTWIEPNIKYHPHTKTKYWLIRKLMG